MYKNHTQFVVYGATGWIGRSFVETAISKFNLTENLNLVLIGSKSREISVSGKVLKVHDYKSAKNYIRPGAIFVNAAFLRREYLAKVPRDEYVHLNNSISEVAQSAIETHKLKSFINLSSGAVKYLENRSSSKQDLYGLLKLKWEDSYRRACNTNKCNFINVRVYSVTGRFINEFENLALSVFIQKALKNEVIEVDSPHTLRTYMDSEQLSEVLMRLSIEGFEGRLDSGGTLIEIEKLASLVIRIAGSGSLNTKKNSANSPDYYGDFAMFNITAAKMGVELIGLEEQLKKTLTAFTH